MDVNNLEGTKNEVRQGTHTNSSSSQMFNFCSNENCPSLLRSLTQSSIRAASDFPMIASKMPGSNFDVDADGDVVVLLLLEVATVP